MNQTPPSIMDQHTDWQGLDSEDTARALSYSYGPRAGEEALFRALLAERDQDGARTRFWIGVWGRISSSEA